MGRQLSRESRGVQVVPTTGSTLTAPMPLARHLPSSVSQFGTNEVVINEIHYDPDSPTTLTEFIELYNHGLTDVDLSGWKFSAGLDYVFDEGSTLPKGSY